MIRQATAALAALFTILAGHLWFAGPDAPHPQAAESESRIATVAPAPPLVPDPLTGQDFLADRAWMPPDIETAAAPVVEKVSDLAAQGLLAAPASLAGAAVKAPVPLAEPVSRALVAPAPNPPPARKPERAELTAILARALALPVPRRRPEGTAVPSSAPEPAPDPAEAPEPTRASLLAPSAAPPDALRLVDLIRRPSGTAPQPAILDADPERRPDYTLADAVADAAWRQETARRLQTLLR